MQPRSGQLNTTGSSYESVIVMVLSNTIEQGIKILVLTGELIGVSSRLQRVHEGLKVYSKPQTVPGSCETISI